LTNLNNGTQVGASNTNGGWLLGAGVEYAFAPQWSARLEYDYLGLNTWNVNSTLFAANADRFSGSRNIQTLTAGVLTFADLRTAPAVYAGPQVDVQPRQSTHRSLKQRTVIFGQHRRRTGKA
jgi:hypothetical protein